MNNIKCSGIGYVKKPNSALNHYQETLWTITQPRVVSYHNDDNHECV
jgi:hypothetical protein